MLAAPPKAHRFFTLSILMLFAVGVNAQLNKYYFYNQAREHISKEQYTQAIASLNQLLVADATIAEAWFLRGLAKYNLSDLQGSLADFSNAIQHNPVYSQALLYRGIVLGQLSRYPQAQPDFDLAIDLRPNLPDGYYCRGVNYLLSLKPLESIRDFTMVIQLNPKHVDAWINRGTAHLYNGDSLRALNDYGQAIKLNPFYSEGYSKRGRLLLQMNSHYLAIDDFTKALQYDSTAAINFFLRAIANNTIGNDNESMLDLNNAIRLNPTNALSLYNRGLMHWKNCSKREALNDFDRVAELNPENILVYFNRGILNMELAKYREAIFDFGQAINIFPDFAKAYLARSSAYAKLGNHREAELDRTFAQSIAERYSQMEHQNFTDTTKTFDNLIAFNSDFAPKTSIPILDEIDTKPIDILPFVRIIAVQASKLQSINQLYVPIDTINTWLRGKGYALTLATSKGILLPDSLARSILFASHLFSALNSSVNSKYYAAIEEYRKALTMSTSNPIALNNLAVELADMVSFIASFENDYGTIDFTQSNRNTNRKPQGLSLQIESFGESIEILEQLIGKEPEAPFLHYNLANIYALTGNMDKAIELLTRAIEYNPNFAEAYYNRGLIHTMRKENQQGCKDLGKAGEQGIKQAYLIIHRFCKR